MILAYPDTRRLYRMMQVLAVFLVVATICIFAVGKWSENQIKEKNDRLFGRWDEVFLNVDEEDVEYFRRHAFVDDYSIQNIQEKIYLEGDDRIIIGTCDDNFFELGNLEMVDGRMPVNEGEVAIEEEYLDVLGVEKVGDIISEGVNIDSLKGYKVCGIVKDYSSRWEMVNWDVKYINCFISDAKANEIQIYASLSPAVQQDIETNMLEYRENLKVTLYLLEDFLFLWFSVIFLQCAIFISIRLKLVSYYNFENSKDRERHFKRADYLRKLTIILLKLCTSILILALINRIVICFGYERYIFEAESIMEEEQVNGAFLYYNESIQFLLEGNYLSEVEILKIIPDRKIKSTLELLSIIIWISFMTYLISYAEKSVNYEKEIKHIQILHYYYGKNNRCFKESLVFVLKELVFYQFICMFVVIRDVSIIPIQRIIVNSMLYTIITGIVILCHFYRKYRYIKCLEASNDWFLVTEFE